MSGAWKSIYVYTVATDKLLTEVIGPFFRIEAGASWGFWERHFAGGPHIRVRLFGRECEASEDLGRLREQLRDWFDTNPSRATKSYSPAFAARLLELEGIVPSAEELAQRIDCVVEGRYPDSLGRFRSQGARRLYERFRCARGPLAIDIIRHEGDRRAAVFKLYLVLALTVGRGDYAVGSVSFRSHWEGFRATFPSELLLEKVTANYEKRKEELCAVARDVRTQWQAQALSASPFLDAWHRILLEAQDDATQALQRGEEIFMHFENEDDVRRGREMLFASHFQRPGAFVEKLWSSERFILGMQHDIRFLRPRVLVNFLYDLVSAVGIGALEKMALCHHAFRAVQDLCNVDLSEYLTMNMRASRRAVT